MCCQVLSKQKLCKDCPTFTWKNPSKTCRIRLRLCQSTGHLYVKGIHHTNGSKLHHCHLPWKGRKTVGWWGLSSEVRTFWVGFFRMKKVWDLVFPWLNWDSLFLFSLFVFEGMYCIHVYENPQDRSCHVNQFAAIRFEKQRDCRRFILVRDVGDFLRTVRLTRWKVKMNKGPAIRNLDQNDYILVVIWQFASWDPDTPKNIHRFTTMETSLWKKIHKSPDLNLKCCCPVLAIPT